MPFYIVRDDITRMEVDAIVNAANRELRMGGGVCGAIFRGAGARRMQEACRSLGPLATGQAAPSPGFDLKATWVIHTVGPIYDQHPPGESERLLEAAYRSALAVAADCGCRSLAFPLISSGIYGYPKVEALEVASRTIRGFLEELEGEDMDVFLAVFDREAFEASGDLMERVQSYIDDRYVDQRTDGLRRLSAREEQRAYQALEDVAIQAPSPSQLKTQEALYQLDIPFSQVLLGLIDDKGLTDVQVYKRANLDRRLFSKIRTGDGYVPGKRTVLALAVALELSLVQAEELLKRAGYALSPAQKFDVIIEYFLLNERYDLFEINEVLFQHDQPLLGG